MRDTGLLDAKGKGRATYYIPGKELIARISLSRELSAPVPELSAPVPELSAPVPELSAPVPELSAPVTGLISSVQESLLSQLPDELKELLDNVGLKCRDEKKIELIIHRLCQFRSMKLNEIAVILNRQPKYVLRKYIQPMMKEGVLRYTIPDMANHPDQAYTINKQI